MHSIHLHTISYDIVVFFCKARRSSRNHYKALQIQHQVYTFRAQRPRIEFVYFFFVHAWMMQQTSQSSEVYTEFKWIRAQSISITHSSHACLHISLVVEKTRDATLLQAIAHRHQRNLHNFREKYIYIYIIHNKHTILKNIWFTCLIGIGNGKVKIHEKSPTASMWVVRITLTHTHTNFTIAETYVDVKSELIDCA